MSDFRVKGLLDRPSPQSLGMLGLVLERETGDLYVNGIVGMSAKPIDSGEFRELLSSGDAQPVDGPLVQEDRSPYCALWVGNEFADNATRLKVQLPPLPKSAAPTSGGGSYWVGMAHHVWRILDSWLVRAFRRSIREDNTELATLMAWAFPDRDETRTALWQTNRRERQANLDWWAKLDRDHGLQKVTPRDLEVRYRRMSNQILSQPPQRVFGFCARAKGGDKEIARELSQRLHIRPLGFGQWLTRKAKHKGITPTRRALQELGQRMIQSPGALEFCLEVLAELPNNISIPNAAFVIEGIRHREVLKSLQALIGEDHFTLVYIERPDSERKRLLIEDEHVSEGEAETIMNDATEQEISNVATEAVRKYPREQGVQGIAMELASIS